MAASYSLLKEELRKKIFCDIGNMIETNINGCAPFSINGDNSDSYEVSAIDSLRAMHTFLNNDNKHMKALKKTVSAGLGAKDMESKAAFSVYETFADNLNIVMKAINSMVDAIEKDDSGKAKDILAIVEGKRGILGSIYRKLLVIITGDENKPNQKLSPDEIRFVQEFSFRKFRIERCEQAMVKAFKELNESGYDTEKVKEVSISIISGAVSLILSETAYILKFDNQ